MSRKLTTSSADRGRPLADFLAERLDLTADATAALVRAGAVYLDRRREEDPARPLGDHHKITVHSPTPRPPPGPTLEPGEVVVVHRDREVLVVDKPAGLPTQATRESSAEALDRAVLALDPGARLLHRIDRDASGLVLFTRTATARQRFAALLETGQLERGYRAIVRGHLTADEGAFELPIGPDPTDRRRLRAGLGRPAVTRYRVVRRSLTGGASFTLLELELVTGRTHQIRVHLSHAGHPLVGDVLYGGGSAPSPAPARLYLHAARLAWSGTAPVVSAVPPAFAELVG